MDDWTSILINERMQTNAQHQLGGSLQKPFSGKFWHLIHFTTPFGD